MKVYWYAAWAKARDAQAGVRARDVEEAGTIGGADPHVFNRNGLLYGKIRGLCPGNRGETGGRPEQRRLFTSFISVLQSFETLGGRALLPQEPLLEASDHVSLIP